MTVFVFSIFAMWIATVCLSSFWAWFFILLLFFWGGGGGGREGCGGVEWACGRCAVMKIPGYMYVFMDVCCL